MKKVVFKAVVAAALLVAITLSMIAGCSAGNAERTELIALAIAEDQRNLEQSQVEDWLNSESAEVRHRLAYAIGAVSDSSTTPYLLVLLSDSSDAVRAEAAFAAGQLGDSSLSSRLVELSVEADSTVRARAIVALSQLGTKAASARLSLVLNDNSETSSFRALAAQSLFRLKDDASLNALIAQAASDDPTIKRSVYYSLSRRSSELAQPLYRLGLREDDDEIKIASLRGLAAIADSSAAEEVKPLMLSGNSWRVKIHALNIARRLGAKSLLPFVMNLTSEDEHRYVQQAAIQAAGELGDITTAMALTKFLQDNNSPFQADALIAISKLSGQVSFPAIQILAASSRPASRRAAAEACGSIGTYPGAQAMLEYLARDTIPMVRAEAVERLLALEVDSITDRYIPQSLEDEDIILVALACNQIVVDTLTQYIQQVCVRYRPAGDPDIKSSLLDCLLEFPLELPSSEVIMHTVRDATEDRSYAIRRRGHQLARKFHEIYDETQPYYSSMVTEANYDSIYTRWENENPRVALKTERGAIVLELFPNEAPRTVYNFLKLIREGFYDGRIWHRVVPDFVIQDGCPRGDGWGGPGYEIRSEDNHLSYQRGSVGMATAGKDTGGSQYFICQSPQPHLDGRYTLFGKVVEGIDLVDQMLVGDTVESVTLVSGMN